MGEWVANNWWWMLPMGIFPVLVALRVRRRGGDEPLGRRVVYALFPLLDAESETRRQLTPRVFILWAVGMLIVLAYAVYDMGFKH
jgi:hypothetical protein